MALVSLTALACSDGRNSGTATADVAVAFGQSAAYFTSSDNAIRPIAGKLPGEGEAVEKVITVKFSGAETVGLALNYEGTAPEGLYYSVNSGEAHAFNGGDIISAQVDGRDVEKRFRLMIWLSNDASGDIAGRSFTFTIAAKVKAHGSQSWDKTTLLAGNTVAGAQPEAYEWTEKAQAVASGGIEILTLDGAYDGEPINLVDLFDVPTLSATFTPTGGTAEEVTDPTAFAPNSSGTLVIDHNNGWYASSSLTAKVTAEASSMVKFSVEYPAWYRETDDIITVTAEGNGTTTTTAVPTLGGYAVKLKNGEYTSLTFTSARFRASVENESVTLSGVTVSPATDLTDETIAFAVTKLSASGTFAATYQGDGAFKLPKGNTNYYGFAGVDATEGFTVKYSMKSDTADQWLNGGFFFKTNSGYCSLMVYPSQGKAGKARLQLTQSTNTTFFNAVGVITTKNVSASTVGIDVEIAYYSEAFYIRIDGDFAVRLGAEMFTETRHCTSNACALYLSAAEWNNSKGGNGYSTIVPATFFGAATRTIGLRAIDTGCTFTGVQYALGNDAAKALIDDMREHAQNDDAVHGEAWATFGSEDVLSIAKPLEAVLPSKDEEKSERQ